jgi:hypothetical protein
MRMDFYGNVRLDRVYCLLSTFLGTGTYTSVIQGFKSRVEVLSLVTTLKVFKIVWMKSDNKSGVSHKKKCCLWKERSIPIIFILPWSSDRTPPSLLEPYSSQSAELSLY